MSEGQTTEVVQHGHRSPDLVAGRLEAAEAELLAAAAGAGDARRALPVTVALTYTRLALAGEVEAGRLAADPRLDRSYLATCLGLAPGGAVDAHAGAALVAPAPVPLRRRLNLRTIRRLAIWTGSWVSITLVVILLAACSPSRNVELPTNEGSGADEMKKSPCACQQLEFNSRGYQWIS